MKTVVARTVVEQLIYRRAIPKWLTVDDPLLYAVQLQGMKLMIFFKLNLKFRNCGGTIKDMVLIFVGCQTKKAAKS